MRLDKYLKETGVCKRSQASKLIKKGLIKVNDIIIKDSGYLLDEFKDVVTYNDNKIEYQEFVYIMMNKPSGVISASTDKKDKTVIDLIKEYKYKNLFPIGRLDKDSEGLLILSNDGKLAHNLLSPKKHVNKVYYLKIKGRLTNEDIKAFNDGIIIDKDYKCKQAKLQIINSDDISECYATISEGKFHQLKKMFKALDKEVIYLKRIQFKNIKLDESLKQGEYRLLTNEEIDQLKNN